MYVCFVLFFRERRMVGIKEWVKEYMTCRMCE
jgi:hypothetical protein